SFHLCHMHLVSLYIVQLNLRSFPTRRSSDLGTKKQGINVLQEMFNVGFDETMVFGDHMNDLEMMSSAYYSYAMKNAEDDVKKNADRKSTRLNSSHVSISYAVFCLKKKKHTHR